MVQVLPGLPTFAQKLSDQLAQVGYKVGEGLAVSRANKMDDMLISSFNANDAPLVQIQKFAKLSEGAQKKISPLFTHLLNSQEKRMGQEAEEEKEISGLKNSLNFLDDNVSYAGTTKIPFTKSFTAGGLNRKAVQKREEIDQTGFLTADAIFTKFNKGVISKDKLKVIQDMAPKAEDSERVYKAKVNSLRRISNLPKDATKEDFDRQVAREEKTVSKIQPRSEVKHLTDDVIDALLSESNGDINKARAKAQKLGYQF